ncbi:MAG TPA: ABC transporter permease subunit [Bacilli bacterium]|nr:ABC transporter permease subunit [Bacilli bacterium]
MSSEAKKARFLYGLAWSLLLLLIFVAVFGSTIKPHGLEAADKQSVVSMNVDGAWKSVSAPFEPSATYWLGTDHRGFDVLSLLLNGAGYTIGLALLITLFRFLLAVPIGLYAGTTGRGRGVLSTMQLATTAVPPLLFIFPMMFGLSKVMGPDQTSLPLFVMLVLLGLFPLANQFAERGTYFNGKLYITAARAMGASNGRIAFAHLMPHLRPELTFAFLTEMVQVLFLFGQLAVIRVFIGGGEIVQLADGAPGSREVTFWLTQSGEWGAMITYGISYIRQYPWIVLSAGSFLVGAILILSFFAKQLQKKNARPYFYNSKPFVQDKRRLAVVGVLAAACLALMIATTGEQAVATEQASAVPPSLEQSTYQSLEVMRTAKPPKRPKKKSANTSSADVQGTSGQSTGDAAETARQNLITSKGWQFVRALEDNDWNAAARTYYDPELPVGQAVAQPTATFAKWIQAFGQGYEPVDIGKVSPMGSEEDQSHDVYRYLVEVKVTTPDGKPETWYLEMIARQLSRTVIDVVIGYQEAPGT